MIAITFDLISDIFLYLRVNQAAKKKTLRQKTKLFPIIFTSIFLSTINLKHLYRKKNHLDLFKFECLMDIYML
jgi:hypothetical protein